MTQASEPHLDLKSIASTLQSILNRQYLFPKDVDFAIILCRSGETAAVFTINDFESMSKALQDLSLALLRDRELLIQQAAQDQCDDA